MCDDGNTTSDDGCRADCAEIEYPVFCAAAPQLVPGTTIDGVSSAGPTVFGASCGEPRHSGHDNLYHFTAPTAGLLHLELSFSFTCFLTVAVSQGCDGPGVFSELGCVTTATASSLEVPVDEGQTVTVLVEEFTEAFGCEYQLSTELLPP